MDFCETCRHWKKTPVDPHNLGAPRMGACAERLHSGIVSVSGNQIQSIGYYPQTVAQFPACGQYRKRAAEEGDGGDGPAKPPVH